MTGHSITYFRNGQCDEPATLGSVTALRRGGAGPRTQWEVRDHRPLTFMKRTSQLTRFPRKENNSGRVSQPLPSRGSGPEALGCSPRHQHTVRTLRVKQPAAGVQVTGWAATQPRQLHWVRKRACPHLRLHVTRVSDSQPHNAFQYK